MEFPIIPTKSRAYPMGAVRFTDRQPETDAPMRSAGRPFFHILTDNGIAVRFLEAVAADPEEAMAFVSKHSAGAIDMEALRDILGTAGRLCNSWVQISYNNNPKNCLTRSVLLVDKERNTKQLLHLHMVREPDRYGQWKIYGVEKE